MPALAITETSTAVSEVAQLVLTVQEGDVCVRTDENKSYIALNATNATMADWQELLTPTDSVTSVNGNVGVVVLTTTDISEGTNKYYTEAKVSANTDVAANTAAKHTQNTDDKIIEGNSSIEVIDTGSDGNVQIKTENVLVGQFHSSGIVDLPKQSGCKAYRNTSVQVISNGALTKVELNAESYDTQSEFDITTNYRFTTKIAGKYLVIGQVQYEGTIADKLQNAYIYKNGASVAFGIDTPNINGSQITTRAIDIIELAIDDYLELWTYQDSGGDLNVRYNQDRTYLSIVKLN